MILELNNISKNFGGVQAITPTSFGIEKGEIFGLIGPNGAGKTTMFNIITGAYAPSSGEVVFEGANITNVKSYKRVNLGIARTFQNIRLFTSMSVLENVLIGLNGSMKYSFLEAALHLGRFRRAENRAKQRARELLDELGILKFENENAANLSYGQQRKVEIARALATNPKLLLLDEPAAGMNPSETDELAELISNLKLSNDYKKAAKQPIVRQINPRALLEIAINMPLCEWLGLNTPSRIASAKRLGVFDEKLPFKVDDAGFERLDTMQKIRAVEKQKSGAVEKALKELKTKEKS